MPTVRILCNPHIWTASLYRAFARGLYLKHNVNAIFTGIRDGRLESIHAEDVNRLLATPSFADERNDLLAELRSGRVDAGVVASGLFLQGVAERERFVAVATIAQEYSDHPMHAILVRKGLHVAKPSDLRGLRLGVRGALLQHALMQEFLAQNGLSSSRDVSLVDAYAGNGVNPSAQAGLFNVLTRRSVLDSGEFVVYRPLDWVDPYVISCLLVFRRAFYQRHRNTVERLLAAYGEELQLEESTPLPEDHLLLYDRFSPPRRVSPPHVDLPSLRDLASLAARHHLLPGRIDLSGYVAPDPGQK
jgi:hypothetical protein